MFDTKFESELFIDSVEVVFDEQEGPMLLKSLKNKLSEKSNKKIVNTSFPDSYSSGGLSRYFYCFTIEENQDILYCYCLYQRVKDDNMSRGYNQKSLTLVSKVCLIEFFKSFMLQFFQDLFQEDLEKNFDRLEILKDVKIQDLQDQIQTKGKINFELQDKNIEVVQKDYFTSCVVLSRFTNILTNINQQIFSSNITRNQKNSINQHSFIIFRSICIFCNFSKIKIVIKYLKFGRLYYQIKVY